MVPNFDACGANAPSRPTGRAYAAHRAQAGYTWHEVPAPRVAGPSGRTKHLTLLEPAPRIQVGKNTDRQQAEANAQRAGNPAYFHPPLHHEPVEHSQHKHQHGGFGKERRTARRSQNQQIEKGDWGFTGIAPPGGKRIRREVEARLGRSWTFSEICCGETLPAELRTFL